MLRRSSAQACRGRGADTHRQQPHSCTHAQIHTLTDLLYTHMQLSTGHAWVCTNRGSLFLSGMSVLDGRFWATGKCGTKAVFLFSLWMFFHVCEYTSRRQIGNWQVHGFACCQGCILLIQQYEDMIKSKLRHVSQCVLRGLEVGEIPKSYFLVQLVTWATLENNIHRVAS